MSILLITATSLEAEPLFKERKWEEQSCQLAKLYKYKNIYLAHLGLAKTNTAAGLALLIQKLKPKSVIQFGIAGMYPKSGLKLAQVVVAETETHIDCGLKTKNGFGMQELGFPLLEKEKNYYNVFPMNQGLKKEFIMLGLEPKPFATSETITTNLEDANGIESAFKVAVESMEGAAAAQVCLALDTAFIELRAISNVVGERNKDNWELQNAVNAVNIAVIAYLSRHSSE